VSELGAAATVSQKPPFHGTTMLATVRRAFIVAALACAGAVSAQIATSPPDAMVRDLTNQVLEAIRADKGIQGGDVSRVQKLVDEKILPYVDFQKMTQLAVGRGWRTATPEQRTALTREFRTLLVRTYSGALSQVKDHKVEMGPFRGQPADTDVLVRTSVVPTRGEKIQLDYRVEKQGDAWKIYDVNVLGVWLVENYKSQFAQQISAGGIDGLIKSLADRNQQLAGKS
jgi:phospholipid transport system substrate-binding protein